MLIKCFPFRVKIKKSHHSLNTVLYFSGHMHVSYSLLFVVFLFVSLITEAWQSARDPAEVYQGS